MKLYLDDDSAAGLLVQTFPLVPERDAKQEFRGMRSRTEFGNEGLTADF